MLKFASLNNSLKRIPLPDFNSTLGFLRNLRKFGRLNRLFSVALTKQSVPLFSYRIHFDKLIIQMLLLLLLLLLVLLPLLLPSPLFLLLPFLLLSVACFISWCFLAHCHCPTDKAVCVISLIYLTP